MATTLTEVQQFLNGMDLKYRVDPKTKALLLSFDMDHYICPDSHEKSLTVVITIEEDGEFIKVAAPLTFSLAEVEFPNEAREVCLGVCYRTKMLQCEYDDSDGEVRFVIEFPLEDALLTQKQLERCIYGIAIMIDRFTPVFDLAVTTGQIDWDLMTKNKPNTDLERMEMTDLLRAAGGAEGLREILRRREVK